MYLFLSFFSGQQLNIINWFIFLLSIFGLFVWVADVG
jgi:hypothetical protein